MRTKKQVSEIASRIRKEFGVKTKIIEFIYDWSIELDKSVDTSRLSRIIPTGSLIESESLITLYK